MLRKHCVHPCLFSNPKLIPVSSRSSALITVSIPARSLSWTKSEAVQKAKRLLLVNTAIDFAQPLSLRDMRAAYGNRGNDRIVRAREAGSNAVEPMALVNCCLARCHVDPRWT